jgi:pilus assembly protein CpaE
MSTQPPPAGNTNVSVVLIAPDSERRRTIAKTIAGTQARIVREFSELPIGNNLAKLIESDCDVIVVDLDSGVGPGVDLIADICARNTVVNVMACSSRRDSDIVIRSMRAGAREFLTEPMAVATVTDAFARAFARRQSAAVNQAAGKLLIFQGAKGGTGVTTLAINFAVALTKEAAGNVVLVDMHPQLGEIALGLGIVPRFSITDALDNSARLDADFVSTLLTRDDSGLMVLASSDVYGTHRSLEHGTEKLLSILREQFAFVIVDAGSCAGNIPDALVELADTIYLVTEVNLPALRNARRLISWFACKEKDVEVVLNRYNSRKVEIDEESTAKALSRTVDWNIPNDYMAVRGAQNLGTSLVMQDTPVSRAVRQMAKAACGKLSIESGHNAAAALKGDKWKFWTSKNSRPGMELDARIPVDKSFLAGKC